MAARSNSMADFEIGAPRQLTVWILATKMPKEPTVTAQTLLVRAARGPSPVSASGPALPRIRRGGPKRLPPFHLLFQADRKVGGGFDHRRFDRALCVKTQQEGELGEIRLRSLAREATIRRRPTRMRALIGLTLRRRRRGVSSAPRSLLRKVACGHLRHGRKPGRGKRRGVCSGFPR